MLTIFVIQGKSGPLLRLESEGEGAELTWLAQSFDTDYFILLDVRNEAAVASLAVKEFPEISL